MSPLPQPSTGSPCQNSGLQLWLVGRAIPQTHLHPSLLSGLLKGWSSNGASDGEQIQLGRKLPELH